MEHAYTDRIHRFNRSADGISLPPAFTFPFFYTPHPLVVQAAGEVQAYLSARTDWAEELAKGKMFGVLVVEDTKGEAGFVAAFSAIWPEATCTRISSLPSTTCCGLRDSSAPKRRTSPPSTGGLKRWKARPNILRDKRNMPNGKARQPCGWPTHAGS